jgi:tetratricopeptide (TPR) repeat protein
VTLGSAGLDWRAALEGGRFEEAHRLYLLAEAPDPDVRRALSALVDVTEFVREKSWARAARRLERLEAKPPLIDWQALAVEVELLAGSSRHLERIEPEEALARLEKGSYRWFPAEAANQRGTAHALSGDSEDARREFSLAVELDPRHFRALTNLGNSSLEAGDSEGAIGFYQRALALNDEFANAHHNLGVAYRRQGKVAASVRQLRRAQRVQHRGERERARENLGAGAGKSGLKALRWALYLLMALALVVILRGRGLF